MSKKESKKEEEDSGGSSESASSNKNSKKAVPKKPGKFLKAEERPKLGKGDVVQGMEMKFEVVTLLGSGGFGDVYKVKPHGGKADFDLAAMKTEVNDDTNNPMLNRLKCEVSILRMLKDLPPKKRTHFTDMYDRGITDNFKFVVMELVGKAIIDLQCSQKNNEFSMTTALKLGIQTLEAIRNLHDIGYIHRDIKPQNFSIGLGNKNDRIYMLDYGIARRYVKKDGSKVLRVPRKVVKFLGTIKYASRACHKSKEQSRKDDLEPWLFMQLEFIDFNSIYWNACRDKKDVLTCKEKLFIGEAPPKKLLFVPLEFSRIMQYIDDLAFTSAPDYEFIIALIKQAARESDCDLNSLYDWQEGCRASKAKRTFQRSGKGLFG